jgi:hypothetical protein
MSLEDPGAASFAGIGGLGEQVRELREVIELPLMNPELFEVRFRWRTFLEHCLIKRTYSVLASSRRKVSCFTDLPVLERHFLPEPSPPP